MFGFDYVIAKDQTELEKQLNSFYKVSKQPKLLEVFTPARSNDQILLDYFKFIK